MSDGTMTGMNRPAASAISARMGPGRWRAWLWLLPFVATIVASLLAASQSKADIVCPKGSLRDFDATLVWSQYAKQSDQYVRRLLKRMSNNLKAVMDARDVAGKTRAASDLGKDNAMVMERMFSEGFIAATDIVNAYCVSAPNREPWSEAIKQQRRQAWCKEWGDAYFCPNS